MDERKFNSLFPDMPRDGNFTDDNGNPSVGWVLGLQALFQALQQNFKNEGIVFPSLNEDDINFIQSVYTPYIGFPLPDRILDISGQTVFDSTNRVSKQFVIVYDAATPPNIVSASWRTFQYV